MAQADSVVIAPGETVRFSAQFSPNILLTHLKTGVVVTDKRVIVRRPNTVLGLVPLGFTDSTSPLTQVTEVTATETISGRKLVSGLFCLFVSLILFVNSDFIGFTGEQSVLLGLILIGVALYLFATAYRIGLIFRNQGSGELLARTARGERRELESSKAHIDVLLFGDDASTTFTHAVAQEVPEALPAADPSPAPATAAITSSPAAVSPARATTATLSKEATPAAAPSTPAAPTVVAPSTPAPTQAQAPTTASGFTAAQAIDPSTPQVVLSKIAELEPSLRPLVAANPNTYPGLLEWLSNLGDPQVDQALAARRS
ncbi:variant leucine-rich repeat-containing protein [Rhodococcoides kroppenstedtii]|uniref:variant leucine-rich repeat-containing protein n=1 Tax=Rhodococcoides kroppenstedtii TaxID=293050 RepID=UPI00363B4379